MRLPGEMGAGRVHGRDSDLAPTVPPNNRIASVEGKREANERLRGIVDVLFFTNRSQEILKCSGRNFSPLSVRSSYNRTTFRVPLILTSSLK